MSRIVPQILTLSQHIHSLKFEPDRYRPSCCPSCGLAGKIHGHGVYFRKANRSRDPDVPSLVPIPRFLCAGCKRSCSRLPECLPPRRWYQWVIQQALLTVLLLGDSLRKAASLTDVARQTGRRWWNWLKDRSNLFALYLKDRFPDWGRMPDLSGFWLRGLSHHPLSSMMTFLDQEGVIVP